MLNRKELIDPSNKISTEKWEEFLECWVDEYDLRTRQMAEEMFYDFCHDDEKWEGTDKPDVSDYYRYGSFYFQYINVIPPSKKEVA